MTREEFADWLRMHEPGTVILPKTREESLHIRCPLARFLQRNGANARVGRKYYEVGNHCYLLPDWAKEFVVAVDGALTSLTTEDCLRLLGEEANL